MVVPYNGMLATELGDVRWLKSWHSNPNGECVELAALPSGEIAMRNSRYPAGPVLLYTQAEITAFLAGAKDGAFDHLLTGTNLPPYHGSRSAHGDTSITEQQTRPLRPATTRRDHDFCRIVARPPSTCATLRGRLVHTPARI
jgi:hypothetical protein